MTLQHGHECCHAKGAAVEILNRLNPSTIKEKKLSSISYATADTRTVSTPRGPVAGTVRTPRLVLCPVGPAFLDDLIAIKADPAVFGVMLNGVRTPERTRAELGEEMAYWDENGFGIWAICEAVSGEFLGVVGLMHRPDGLGVALRYALRNEAQGRGFAGEAAAGALRYGHTVAGLDRIVAVVREDNLGSRGVLRKIGMEEVGSFGRDGCTMLVVASQAAPLAHAA